MKFLITSTNYAYDDIKVCKEAKIEKDVFGNSFQTIELNTLDEFLSFAKSISPDLVLMKNECEIYPFKIEIYNDYRE